MDYTLVKFDGVYKKFTRDLRRSLIYGTTDILRSMVGISANASNLRRSEFWSLEDINFEVRKGETFGLLGSNGSGKSTLLRLINGIFPPDKGRIEINGRIGALIAVGAGFHPHMSGRENIYLNGTILGMKRKEIDQRFDEIVAFSEIEEFLDAPVATYSSGMHVRLGFSIAIHSRPDIVLVDEILAVGDATFQRKCLDKISEMRKNGVSFFLVSHNTWNIEAMCDRALLLNHGKQLMIGNSGEVVARYELLLMNKGEVKENIPDIGTDSNLKRLFCWNDWGTQKETSVESIFALNKNKKESNTFSSNEPFNLKVSLKCLNSIDEAYLYLSFRYLVNDTNLEVTMENENIETMAARKKISLKAGVNHLDIHYDQLMLATGKYMIGLMVYDQSYNLPHFNSYFGFLYIENEIPTMLRAGKGTPLVWSEPEFKIQN